MFGESSDQLSSPHPLLMRMHQQQNPPLRRVHCSEELSWVEQASLFRIPGGVHVTIAWRSRRCACWRDVVSLSPAGLAVRSCRSG